MEQITNDDCVEQVARQQLRQLITRHSTLHDRADELQGQENPLHNPECVRAEADGVLKGLTALRDVVDMIEAETENRPD